MLRLVREVPNILDRRYAVRQLKRGPLKTDAVVLIRGGTYRLARPLVFGPEDGGTKRHSITYAAYPGERPLFSGGRRISGWTAAKEPGVAIIDVPIADKDIRHYPLSKRGHSRRAASAALLAVVPPGFRIVVPMFIYGDERARVEQLIDWGGEGVVLKMLNSGYRAGRQSEWRKYKATQTVDCVVTAYQGGHGKYEGTVGALVLELLREDEWVVVGTCSGNDG